MKERKKPKISVIVPTFKRSDMLSRALDSILAQTWNNIEIIVVDDNEHESEAAYRTQKCMESYRDKAEIVYLKTSGCVGGGAARNIGIHACTGEYVAFLDDDDRYLPDKLEQQIRYMQKHNLDCCYQDVKWYDSNEKLVEFRKMNYTEDYSREGLLKAHILHSIAPTSIYMIRRDKLMETEGFGEVSSGQDFILMLRCIENGMKIGYMPGAYVIQYLHDGERISLGESKIKGENGLYQLKHGYFHLLTKAERHYVRFRHYAVLAFASMRNHQYIYFLIYGMIAAGSAPIVSIKEAIRYFGSKFGG